MNDSSIEGVFIKKP